MIKLPNIKRALILGDTHANRFYLETEIENAIKCFDIDAVFQVGDFGYWPAFDDCKKMFEKYSIPVYFLDGNHEDFSALNKFTDPINEVSENLFYIKRGTAVKIGKRKCLFIGGAFSIDWQRRIKGLDWFDEEMITNENIDACLKHTDIDIILSHDVPLRVNILHDTHFQSIKNREKLDILLDDLQPEYWFFGHYHMNYKNYYHKTSTYFVGLGGNTCPGAPEIFDFEQGKLLEDSI